MLQPKYQIETTVQHSLKTLRFIMWGTAEYTEVLSMLTDNSWIKQGDPVAPNYEFLDLIRQHRQDMY
jgi:hypothetical protein